MSENLNSWATISRKSSWQVALIQYQLWQTDGRTERF